MKIKLVTVGKVKEAFYRDAIAEYIKRLSKFCNTEIIEVEDEKTPDKASSLEVEKILAKEGDKVLSKIKDNEFLITLEIEGKRFTSEGLASKLSEICISGFNTITFVIGGSLGLDNRIKKKSNLPLSFSDFTFPHQLMRVILLEQVYRAFKINSGEPYHK